MWIIESEVWLFNSMLRHFISICRQVSSADTTNEERGNFFSGEGWGLEDWETKINMALNIDILIWSFYMKWKIVTKTRKLKHGANASGCFFFGNVNLSQSIWVMTHLPASMELVRFEDLWRQNIQKTSPSQGHYQWDMPKAHQCLCQISLGSKAGLIQSLMNNQK